MKMPVGYMTVLTPEQLADGLRGHRFLVAVRGSDEPQLVEVTGVHTDHGIEVKAVNPE